MFPTHRVLRRVAFALAAAALIAGAVVGLAPRSPTVASASSSGWVETWAAAMTKPTSMVTTLADHGFRDQTIRDVISTSVGGQEVRIRLSNLYGDRPLRIGAATVGAVASDGNLSGSAYPVTFNGSPSVVIPVGEEVVSDAVAMPVSALEDLAVSIYVPQETGPATFHFFAEQDNYIASGNHVSDTSDRAYATHDTSWYFLDGVEVLGADKKAGTVVAFGDSITDGIGSTTGANDRWPNFLARRLDAKYGAEAPGVLDMGVGGNRVLNPSACYGASGVGRFNQDVLDQPGVKAVIVLEGINDIGYSQDADVGCLAPTTNVSAAQIIGGYKKMIAMAHAHGIKIIGATLTPFESSWFWTVEGQAKWTAVNHWILTSGAFDGVVNFAQVVGVPGNANYVNSVDDSGDGLHPSDAGYQAMADAINLSLLR
jgi:lysophospholipase L1-like esterase